MHRKRAAIHQACACAALGQACDALHREHAALHQECDALHRECDALHRECAALQMLPAVGSLGRLQSTVRSGPREQHAGCRAGVQGVLH